MRYSALILILSLSYFGSPNCYADSSYERAVNLYNQKNFDKAAIAFEQIIKSNTMNANAYYYLGLSYMQSHQSQQAKSIFSQTIKHFPETTAATLATKALQGLESASSDSSTSVTTVSKQQSIATTSANITDDGSPRQFVVPYTMRGPKYMVNAAVNGHPIQMCVDTGCNRIIIPIEYIDEIGLDRPAVQYSGHYSSTGTGFWRKQANIQLGPLARKNITIDIFDTSPWPGVPLLGNTFFDGFSRSFNSDNATLKGIKETQQQDNTLSGSGECLIPFKKDRYRHSPLIEISINGHITNVMFDSGGNNAIWITYEEAASLGIDPDNGTREYIGSSRIPCVHTSIDKVQIGKVVLQDVKTMIFDKSQATWGTDIICFGSAMLPEYGYNFVIDNKTNVIRLRKQ